MIDQIRVEAFIRLVFLSIRKLKDILSIQKSFVIDRFFESYSAANTFEVNFSGMDCRVDSLETADFSES